MIEIKPTPVIRLLVVIALAVLCLSSVWFQIESKGTYVEGIDREPTLWANYSIDGEVEVMELEISNATPLMLYWFERDNINNNTNTSNSNNTLDSDDGNEPNSSEESFLNLSRARIIVKLTVLLCCVLELLCIIRPKKIIRGAAICFWFAGLFALVILVPTSLVTGFGGADTQPGDGFDTGEESDASQFAHSKFTSDLDFTFGAIVWSFESEGFDLGLVDEQHRDSVRQSPPEQGEPGAESFIRFAGDVSIVTSEGVWFWLSIPLFWLLITILDGIIIRIIESYKDGGENTQELQ